MAEHFDGETFEQGRDGKRLSSQLLSVRLFMAKRFPQYATLTQIAEGIGAGPGSTPGNKREAARS